MEGILLSGHLGDPETKRRFSSWHDGVYLGVEMLLGGGWRPQKMIGGDILLVTFPYLISIPQKEPSASNSCFSLL